MTNTRGNVKSFEESCVAVYYNYEYLGWLIICILGA